MAGTVNVRLFVALDVDRDTREAATRLRARLRRERPTVEQALRWVDPDNLHLTLRFLGERDDVDVLQEAVSRPFAQGRFALQWTTPSWLPPQGRPRVLNVAVGDGAAAVASLADELTRRLGALGVPPEQRPYLAHLTLARVRDAADRGVVRQLAALFPQEPFAPEARVPVSAVVLYESRLSPGGPTYHVRSRCMLG